jgi:four helix bundle protein
MTEIPNTKPEDLESRTFRFASDCKRLIKGLPKNITNLEYAKQLTRSSGSVAANYIEANEALSKKDFVLRCRISRKEVKESRMWLRLIDTAPSDDRHQTRLIAEATELLKIFSAIIDKVS